VLPFLPVAGTPLSVAIFPIRTLVALVLILVISVGSIHSCGLLYLIDILLEDTRYLGLLVLLIRTLIHWLLNYWLPFALSLLSREPSFPSALIHAFILVSLVPKGRFLLSLILSLDFVRG